jgi:hypothetical protein
MSKVMGKGINLIKDNIYRPEVPRRNPFGLSMYTSFFKK